MIFIFFRVVCLEQKLQPIAITILLYYNIMIVFYNYSDVIIFIFYSRFRI